MALQSGNSKRRSICTASIEKNKLQALTKMDVTYKWNVAQSCNFYHRICYEQGQIPSLYCYHYQLMTEILCSKVSSIHQ